MAAFLVGPPGNRKHRRPNPCATERIAVEGYPFGGHTGSRTWLHLFDVNHSGSRSLVSVVLVVDNSPFTRWSLPAPSAGSGECPMSFGSVVPRAVAISLSNVPDVTTWAPRASTRVRSFASEL